MSLHVAPACSVLLRRAERRGDGGAGNCRNLDDNDSVLPFQTR